MVYEQDKQYESSASTLLELKRDPDPDALDRYVQRHFAMVYSTCLRITRNRHDAEDAAQAVFLCLATHMREGRPVRAVGPWLHQVATRAALDIHRRRLRRHNHEIARGQAFACEQRPCDPVADLDMDELQETILQALNELPRRYRLPLILHYMGGLTHAELAEELRCNRATLRVRMHRAHKMLREVLEQRGVTLAGSLAGMVLAASLQYRFSQEVAASALRVSHAVASETPFSIAFPSDVSAIAATIGGKAARTKFIALGGLIAFVGLTVAARPAWARVLRDLPEWRMQIQQIQLPFLPHPRLDLPRLQLSEAGNSPAPQRSEANAAAPVPSPAMGAIPCRSPAMPVGWPLPQLQSAPDRPYRAISPELALSSAHGPSSAAPIATTHPGIIHILPPPTLRPESPQWQESPMLSFDKGNTHRGCIQCSKEMTVKPVLCVTGEDTASAAVPPDDSQTIRPPQGIDYPFPTPFLPYQPVPGEPMPSPFLQGPAANAVVTVPEPSGGIVLLALGGIWTLRRRRH